MSLILVATVVTIHVACLPADIVTTKNYRYLQKRI
jgi:hypothetical protein